MNLFERVTKIGNGIQVIKDWLGSGGVAVGRTLAQSRADVCLKCPMNVQGAILTETVAAAIKEHVQVKNQMGLRVTGEKSLGQCSACLCALRLKIWCPIEFIAGHTDKEELANYGRPCWIRDEVERTA
jgi:hypothetical protein